MFYNSAKFISTTSDHPAASDKATRGSEDMPKRERKERKEAQL